MTASGRCRPRELAGPADAAWRRPGRGPGQPKGEIPSSELHRSAPRPRALSRRRCSRIAGLGAAAALAPSSRRAPLRTRRERHRRARRSPRPSAGTSAPPRARLGHAGAHARPVARGRAVRLQLGGLHRREHDQELLEEVRDQGHLRLLRHRRHRWPSSRRQQRLRRLVPDSINVPAFRSKGALLQPLDLGQIPNIDEPRRGVAGPGLRPGQRALRAVHVVDDGRRLRHDEGRRHARRAGRPSGTPQYSEQDGDARRLPGGLLGLALFQLGY